MTMFVLSVPSSGAAVQLCGGGSAAGVSKSCFQSAGFKSAVLKAGMGRGLELAVVPCTFLEVGVRRL